MNFAPLVPWSEIPTLRESLKISGRRVIVTNGCFDLLHVGHLRYLTCARELGDFLWVGLNADASVRQLKGPHRPLNTEADRAEILSGLRMVDAVSIFPQLRATEFLRVVQPDVYVKGGDYTVETLDPEERAALQACGARIQILPQVPGKSTATIQRMAKSE
jgi:rfaE bifunctional protein nucleotidyltransferase chain/domain